MSAQLINRTSRIPGLDFFKKKLMSKTSRLICKILTAQIKDHST